MVYAAWNHQHDTCINICNLKKIKLAIFASGSGSNAEQIIKHFQGHPRIQVSSICTNNAKAGVISRAHKYGVPVKVLTRAQFYENNHVGRVLQNMGIDAIVLAGFLWLVPSPLIDQFPGRIINIHPALLPKYGGAGMYGMHVHRAVIEAQETESGITIHEVNEKYDEGRVVFQATCSVAPEDTPESLVKKIHALEHQHFAKVIENWL